jgi:hypothetical protein
VLGSEQLEIVGLKYSTIIFCSTPLPPPPPRLTVQEKEVWRNILPDFIKILHSPNCSKSRQIYFIQNMYICLNYVQLYFSHATLCFTVKPRRRSMFVLPALLFLQKINNMQTIQMRGCNIAQAIRVDFSTQRSESLRVRFVVVKVSPEQILLRVSSIFPC